MTEKIFSHTESREGLVNTLKSEHLSEGVKPIMFCVGTPDDFKKDPGPVSKIFRQGNDSTIDNVDFSEGVQEILTKNGFKNPEFESYVISPVDSKDKLSAKFKNCTGVIVSGKDKNSEEFISFLSHQSPEYFLSDDPEFEMFLSDLKEKAIEMKNRCIEGTVDAVILGGNYAVGDEKVDQWNDAQKNKTFREDYFESIQLLVDEMSGILGFEPPIITGPQISLEHGDEEDVYYDNKEKRLYIVKPEVGDSSTESYMAGNIKEQEKKWTADVLAKKAAKIEEVSEMKKKIREKKEKKQAETVYEKIKKLFQ
jgi:hypothetical protein